jgi:hypothetical protein
MEYHSYLHAAMPHVEKLADFLVLPRLPIYSLTSPGAIDGGEACIAVLKLEIWRTYGFTDASLGHVDCLWSVTRKRKYGGTKREANATRSILKDT